MRKQTPSLMNIFTRIARMSAAVAIVIDVGLAVSASVGIRSANATESAPVSVGNVSMIASAKTPVVRLFPAQSYLRLANLSDAPVTHRVEIYGLNSQSTLGSVQLTVPAKASLQVQPGELLQSTHPEVLDQFIALYIDPTTAGQFFQHVRIDPSSGEVSDATTCVLRDFGSAAPAAAINVHTNRIQRNYSYVTVHNSGAEPIALQARLTDSQTGARLGTTAIFLPPRWTHGASGIWYQLHGGLSLPTAEQQHFNIEFVPIDGRDTSALVVSHEVKDTFSESGIVNLSTICPIAELTGMPMGQKVLPDRN